MKPKITLAHLVVFGLLGALLLLGDLLMEWLPNVHLVAVLLTVYTVVYRGWALLPLYVYVLSLGLLNGFAAWWVPYLYVWTVLWGVVMLLPKTMPPRMATVIYGGVTLLHGLCFGLLYAPFQVLLFHLPWELLPAWVAAGLPFDVVHGIGNACLSVLIVPLVAVLRRCNQLLN